ncbi:hypothetical protein, partial [Sansalvadorimonas verongulae]|uniref:hypothetical protein n=1 Tax=Sansalvadorimonas verongulae TaxID=2172824 RepID=UPI001E40A6ED
NIPARYVSNEIHAFPEYSLDNGNTWRAEDLGGGGSKLSLYAPNFQTVVSGVALTGNNQWMSRISPDMSPEK